MQTDAPFLVDDPARLRRDLAEAEAAGTRRGSLWAAVRRAARASPRGFPWFTPFVALVTGERGDAAAAADVLRAYASRLSALPFTSGLQYHFWCFAFPHAKWCLYFQWLCTLGAFEPAEARALEERLLQFQITNFLYGMRTKPEPECVDNQALSLCLSNALTGTLFASGEKPWAMAALLRDEGMRRLPSVLGGIPRSGYTGEGSDYMDCVIGPAIPLVVELMERTGHGTRLEHRAFAPSGVTPIQVLRMVAREWLPCGLLLPWDNYGYKMGVRSAMAWAAARTGDGEFSRVLEDRAAWSYDIGVGWAYDDLPWTLAWWPGAGRTRQPASLDTGTPDWFEPEVGGAVESSDHALYLAQLWDRSEPGVPTRSHMNPNQVIVSAYGSPLSVDGTPAPGCSVFDYPDTVRTVRHSIGTDKDFNFGSGCAGAHSVIIVDGWEGMRMSGSGPQLLASGSDRGGDGPGLWADVTPAYAERWPDARVVRRRSRLHHDRFFTVEDLVSFSQEHEVRARFLLRPERVSAARGLRLHTAEGVGLHVIPVLGPDELRVREAPGYPDCLESDSRIVDFMARARNVHWLFLLFPSRTRVPESVAGAWACWPDETSRAAYREAADQLARTTCHVPFTLPAYMLADLPVTARWWYRKSLPVPHDGDAWLRLPRGMMEPAVWMDGAPVEVKARGALATLVQPDLPFPARRGAAVDVVVRCTVPVSHYEGKGWGTVGLNGTPAVCSSVEEEKVMEASWSGGRLRVVTNLRSYESACALMEDA
jgi:hypothetical protein